MTAAVTRVARFARIERAAFADAIGCTGTTLLAALVALAALTLAGPVQAEPSAVSATGFLITHQRDVKAPPRVVYETLGRVEQWWDPRHTWSGSAANLGLELAPGGCFCERWQRSAVEHGRVVAAQPDALVRLQAALGPLQELPVVGVLTFAITPIEAGARLVVTYRVGGPADAALAGWAQPVDQVIGQQVLRLVTLLETGRVP